MIQRAAWRKTAFVAAVFAAVWAIAFVYWRSTFRVPSGQDIALIGVGLPVALILAFAGLRAGIDRLRKPKAAAAPQPAADAAPAPAAPDPDLTSTLALLDSSFALPAGSEADEVIAKAIAQDTTGLYPGLLGPNALPAVAAGVESLDLDAFDEHRQPGDAPLPFDDEQRRALLLAADVLLRLLERHAVIEAPGASPGPTPAPPPFRLHLILPQRWREAAPAMAAWLGRAAGAGWRPALAPPEPVLAEHAGQAFAVVDALHAQLRQAAAEDRHIVLACDSWLSEAALEAWGSRGWLYDSRQPNGHVPGESACALLLARADGAPEPAARIHRLVAGRRAGSLDDPGQRRDDTLFQLLERARTQTAASELALQDCAIVGDAGQRSTRNTEFNALARQAWPDLEADECAERHLPLGRANGESDAALALATLAIAAAHSLKAQQPAFAVTLSDGLARAAVLVTPPPAEAASAEPA